MLSIDRFKQVKRSPRVSELSVDISNSRWCHVGMLAPESVGKIAFLCVISATSAPLR